jgi:WD40 repeat protein
MKFGKYTVKLRIWFGGGGSRLEAHFDPVKSVDLMSDDTRIVSGSIDRTTKVWDLNTGKLLNTLEGHSSSVNSVAITSDNSKIVSGSYDKTIRI